VHGEACELFKMLSCCLPDRTEETTNVTVRTVGTPAEIQTVNH